MRRIKCYLSIFVFFSFVPAFDVFADDAENKNTAVVASQVVDTLKEPLYNPFVERYVLDELKTLRTEMAAQKLELNQQILDRDLMVADKAMSYSTNTVTYFFYFIAAASSALVILGWTTIRDIRDKVQNVAEREILKLVETYEQRLHAIEKQLTQKTAHIDENRMEIERTKETHSLWLRAAQEHSATNKIAIYDEILRLRPYDSEAMTYKADAALDLNEPLWAKNLCLQVIGKEPDYGHAHFQLACANVALGEFDEAVTGLEKALGLSDSISEDIRHDGALKALWDYPTFIQLLEDHNIRLDPSPEPSKDS